MQIKNFKVSLKILRAVGFDASINRVILNNLVPLGGSSVKSNKSYDVIMRERKGFH